MEIKDILFKGNWDNSTPIFIVLLNLASKDISVWKLSPGMHRDINKSLLRISFVSKFENAGFPKPTRFPHKNTPTKTHPQPNSQTALRRQLSAISSGAKAQCKASRREIRVKKLFSSSFAAFSSICLPAYLTTALFSFLSIRVNRC